VIRRTIACLVLPAVLLAACGDDEQRVGVDKTPTGASVESGLPTTTVDPADAEVRAEVEARGKPTVTVPDAPATELGITDDIEGTGAAVPEGATVTVHYVGVGQQSGKEFDASWGSSPVTFPLARVIPGWTQGLVGMKVGGRRTLVIPGDLAYGDNPTSPDIAPGETLVFTIDLIGIS
jgi:peptidylprolyl isomerase